MSFKKVGDAMPIVEFYDDNDQPALCPQCGKSMVIISIDSDTNELVCQKCHVEEPAQDD